MIQYALDAVLNSAAQKLISFFNAYLVLLIILCAAYTSELLRQVTGSRLN